MKQMNKWMLSDTEMHVHLVVFVIYNERNIIRHPHTPSATLMEIKQNRVERSKGRRVDFIRIWMHRIRIRTWNESVSMICRRTKEMRIFIQCEHKTMGPRVSASQMSPPNGKYSFFLSLSLSPNFRISYADLSINIYVVHCTIRRWSGNGSDRCVTWLARDKESTWIFIDKFLYMHGRYMAKWTSKIRTKIRWRTNSRLWPASSECLANSNKKKKQKWINRGIISLKCPQAADGQ